MCGCARFCGRTRFCEFARFCEYGVNFAESRAKSLLDSANLARNIANLKGGENV